MSHDDPPQFKNEDIIGRREYREYAQKTKLARAKRPQNKMGDCLPTEIEEKDIVGAKPSITCSIARTSFSILRSPACVVKQNDSRELLPLETGIDELLHDIFPGSQGHFSLPTNDNDEDLANARRTETSLLYGEFIPEGVRCALSKKSMDVDSAKVLLDFGSGQGKFALQAFLEAPQLDTVLGVDISRTRFRECAKALQQFEGCKVEDSEEGEPKRITLTERRKDGSLRQLLLFRHNILDDPDFLKKHSPDIIIMNVALHSISPELRSFFLGIKLGARLLAYSQSLEVLWETTSAATTSEDEEEKKSPRGRGGEKAKKRDLEPERFPFKSIAKKQRYRVTWSAERGYNFKGWKRV